ncbi:hypothetical protein D3C85_1513200 [compost metagenome]
MSGDEHAADGVNERPDPVAEKLRAHGKPQGCQVLFAAEGGQRLLLFDGHAHLLAGGAGIEESGFFEFFGIAQVQLAHQQVEAVEVVAHRQGRHAVNTGLQKLLRPAFAHLGKNVAALLLTATGEEAHRQANQQPAMPCE